MPTGLRHARLPLGAAYDCEPDTKPNAGPISVAVTCAIGSANAEPVAVAVHCGAIGRPDPGTVRIAEQKSHSQAIKCPDGHTHGH